MASWLFGGISKLKNDHIVETKDTLPAAPTVNPEPVNNLPSVPHLLYDLKPVNHPAESNKSDQNVKQANMLDSIPFVLSNQININSDHHHDNLEETKRFLLTVKANLESDVYNYDFSNDRRLVRDGTSYIK